MGHPVKKNMDGLAACLGDHGATQVQVVAAAEESLICSVATSFLQSNAAINMSPIAALSGVWTLLKHYK
jgi:tetrahydromethanopterin S-methyltransferase subunit C